MALLWVVYDVTYLGCIGTHFIWQFWRLLKFWDITKRTSACVRTMAHTHTNTHTHTHKHTHADLCTYIHLYMHSYVHTQVHMYINTHHIYSSVAKPHILSEYDVCTRVLALVRLSQCSLAFRFAT